METKRTKLWRRKQGFRVFKARMQYFAAWYDMLVMDDGQYIYRPRWFQLARCHWTNAYRSTGTPCSCYICQGEQYNRLDYKRETQRIIKETLE